MFNSESVCVATGNTAGALLMVMTAIVLTQVVFCYVLNDSLASLQLSAVSKNLIAFLDRI